MSEKPLVLLPGSRTEHFCWLGRAGGNVGAGILPQRDADAVLLGLSLPLKSIFFKLETNIEQRTLVFWEVCSRETLPLLRGSPSRRTKDSTGCLGLVIIGTNNFFHAV